MNTRQKLQRFIEERDAFIEASRIQHGYGSRANARAVWASHAAGFMSAMFGSTLTMYVYLHYDFHPLFSFLRSLQYVSGSDLLDLMTSLLHGMM
jgi:hypothetical protein